MTAGMHLVSLSILGRSPHGYIECFTHLSISIAVNLFLTYTGITVCVCGGWGNVCIAPSTRHLSMRSFGGGGAAKEEKKK